MEFHLKRAPSDVMVEHEYYSKQHDDSETSHFQYCKLIQKYFYSKIGFPTMDGKSIHKD